MSSLRVSAPRGSMGWSVVPLATALILILGGCTHVAGNYPAVHLRPVCTKAQFDGEGFQLMAGSRLRLDLVEAELSQLKSQGFSRRNPQIIRSVARRKHVPPALLADRSGSGYYRFTARLDPGTSLVLDPGALEVTVLTKGGIAVFKDQGYLLEDRRIPGGCRPPLHSTLAFEPLGEGTPQERDFLVRLPVRGEIVDVVIVPGRCRIIRK